MDSMEQIASVRAGQNRGAYMAWLDVLSEGFELCKTAGLSESRFERLLESCKRPDQFRLLMEALAEWRKEHPEEPTGFDLLAEAVDESPYGLSDWVESIEYFYDWLGQNQRQASFQSLLGFLHCCVQAAGSGPERPPLKDLLMEMLDTYGFQG